MCTLCPIALSSYDAHSTLNTAAATDDDDSGSPIEVPQPHTTDGRDADVGRSLACSPPRSLLPFPLCLSDSTVPPLSPVRVRVRCLQRPVGVVMREGERASERPRRALHSAAWTDGRTDGHAWREPKLANKEEQKERGRDARSIIWTYFVRAPPRLYT